jgi:O-succinylbenzoate synthase
MSRRVDHLGANRRGRDSAGRLLDHQRQACEVGGYLEARRIHDLCVANGVPAWCGGMLESGLGRAANIALAALPGFTLTGDTSPSDRYYAADLTTPFVLEDRHIAVPTGPGIGVDPIPEVLDEVTTSVQTVALR